MDDILTAFGGDNNNDEYAIDSSVRLPTGGSSSTSVASAAYALRQLLRDINDNNHSSPFNERRRRTRLFIIGTTRISPSDLPRSHTGAPEFETIISLPRPSFEDRKQIIMGLLAEKITILEDLLTVDSFDAKEGRELEGEGIVGREEEEEGESILKNKDHLHSNYDISTVNDNTTDNSTTNPNDSRNTIDNRQSRSCQSIHTNDDKWWSHNNLQVWSNKLAILTAGFLPGDLLRIIKRAGYIYVGQRASASTLTIQLKANSNSYNSTTTNVSREFSNINSNNTHREVVLTWRFMLSAVASLPPAQLQKLNKITSGLGGGGGGTMSLSSSAQGGEPLTWNYFGGYGEVKTKLKKLLNMNTSVNLTSRKRKRRSEILCWLSYSGN